MGVSTNPSRSQTCALSQAAQPHMFRIRLQALPLYVGTTLRSREKHLGSWFGLAFTCLFETQNVPELFVADTFLNINIIYIIINNYK